MEKRRGLEYVFLLVLLVCTLIVSSSLTFAQLLNASVSNNTGQENVYQLYNITVNNTNASAGINFTQVNITVPYTFSVAYPISTTTTNNVLSNTTTIFSWTNTSAGGFISNGTSGYFWLNAAVNQTGTYNITVTTLDTSGNFNLTSIPIFVNDTIPPFVEFIPYTEGLNSTGSINYSHISVNVTSSDFGSGINNTVIYLYNSTGLLVYASTAHPGSYDTTFPNLADGTYYINATAYDLAGNSNSTPTITVEINTTIIIPCTPNWGCTSWGNCTNETETCINVNDSNLCGVAFDGTYPTQSCSCNHDWSCTVTPAVCTNGTQIRTCTDLNNCSPPEVQDQTCVIGSSVNSTPQQAVQTSGEASSSLFYVIIGFIVLVVIIVVFILVRLKKKSSSTDFGGYSSSNQNSGYTSYPPPTSPPSGNSSGYPSQYPSYPSY